MMSYRSYTTPINPANYKMFKEELTRGQHVVVSGVHNNLSKTLWEPAAFSRDFGYDKSDLVNCVNDEIVADATVGYM